MKKRIKTIFWAIRIACKMNFLMLLVWLFISSFLAILPAISLKYNEQVIDILNTFINNKVGQYSDIVAPIVVFGVLLTLVGLASRINGDFLYIIMYDSYYIGLQELLMTSINKFEMKEMMNGSLNDEYHFAIGRAGALTDFISGACALVGKAVSIVSLLFVAFTASKMVFFVSSIYMILIIAFDIYFSDKIRFDSRKIFGDERFANYLASIPRDINIAKEIRIYENTEDIVKQWDEANLVVEKNDIKRRSAVESQNFIAEFGFYLFVILIIGYMLWALSKGDINVTKFLILYTLTFNIQKTISNLSREIYNCDYGLFALEKQKDLISKVKNEEKKDYNIDTNHEVVFELRDVNFEYIDDRPILKNISFQIKKGEVIALVGENGSGKSTLANILLNIYSPKSGSVYLFGKNMDEYSKNDVRKLIGSFFQDYFIFHETLRDNVLYGDINQTENNQKIDEAIKKGGADVVVAKLPYGVDTFMGKSVEEKGVFLSGGENQRVAVSRAHMSDKEIMIFDEPAAALDPIAEMEQFVFIRNKIQGRTAILISHRVGFARMADRIIMLKDGMIVETGTHDELMKKGGSYAQFFNSQAEWYH